MDEKTILLVEDETVIAMAERSLLERNGYRVETTFSGEKAVEAAGKMPEPDLILMDINLGRGIDGIETARQILARHDIPLIFLSSYTEREMVEEIEDITSYGYVVKNSGETVLMASIKMAFRLFEATTRERNKADALLQSEQNLKTLFDAIDESVGLMDTDGTILAANKTFGSRLGLSVGDCLNKDIYSLVPPEVALIRRRIADTVFATGEPAFFEDERNGIYLHHHLYPVRDTNGRTVRVVIYATDITEQRKTVESLRVSEAIYRTLFQVSPMGLAISDSQGKIIDSNAVAQNILGLTREEHTARKLDGAEWHIIRRDGTLMDAEEYASVRAMKEQLLVENVDMGIVKGPDEISWITVSSAPVPIDGYGVVIAFADITERVAAEERIKILLREKELLLRETHHRIKNNMGTIGGLLSLHANEQEDESMRRILNDASSRVGSMMLLYDKLYHSENFTELGIRQYLPPLVDQIMAIFDHNPNVRTDLDLEDFVLSSRSLSSLGIILNEMITNSMKYAFRETPDARIAISAVCREQQVRIEYSDNGSGLPESVGFDGTQGFGVQLIGILVQQLEGTIEIIRGGGARYKMVFPRK